MDWGEIPFGDNSQFGEAIALLYIFSRIGVTNKIAVEIGAADGIRQSNSLLLEQVLGFQRYLFDIAPEAPNVIKANITVENVNGQLRAFDIPQQFDMLCIDIDGNDYWIWNALEFQPRTVIMEFNHSLGFLDSKTIKYNPQHTFQHNQYYGATAPALVKLGKSLGYKCIARSGTNLIFVLKGLVPNVPEITLPATGPLQGQKRGWPDAPEGSIWISV